MTAGEPTIEQLVEFATDGTKDDTGERLIAAKDLLARDVEKGRQVLLAMSFDLIFDFDSMEDRLEAFRLLCESGGDHAIAARWLMWMTDGARLHGQCKADALSMVALSRIEKSRLRAALELIKTHPLLDDAYRDLAESTSYDMGWRTH